ncbi:hypothetical protein LTR56_009575 [Elasticomyces elasticus]|nr:hypothetical protein LTR56_009575 [Elasticomyces elasticus]KAK3657254.1 hypothetical protein LTR22_009428 [Elasticomyces elasticus]KAK4922199.1 hypothetical protein LTR49_010420 [Elasticomyces elasticus]KAK5760862.1 hypothetical protein LTS12_009038 [Elasticomyces elasticus]
MATSGELTKSGLLYEGNYTEWRSRIDSLLVLHGVDVDKISQPTYRDWHGLAERQKAAKLITDQTRKPCSSAFKRWPSRISLQAVAKPFRFSDLPPELRVNVYDFAFAIRIVRMLKERHGRREDAWKKYQSGFPTGPVLPDLLLASRSISAEGLPIFYSKLRPVVELPYADLPGSQDEEPSGLCAVRQWAQNSLKGDVRHIRALGLFGYHGYKGFPAEKKEAWEKHIANTETNRKALGLQGEALILCFTSRPELWH